MSLQALIASAALHESEMTEEQAKEEFFDVVKKKYPVGSFGFTAILDAYTAVEVASAEKIRDDGSTYLSHVRTVALVVMALGYREWRDVVVALLHDKIEDFGVRWLFWIFWRFGPDVAMDIWGLTRPYDDGRLNRASSRAKRTKIIDRLHNMKTYHIYSDEKRGQKIKETVEDFMPLAVEVGLDEVLRHFLEK